MGAAGQQQLPVAEAHNNARYGQFQVGASDIDHGATKILSDSSLRCQATLPRLDNSEEGGHTVTPFRQRRRSKPGHVNDCRSRGPFPDHDIGLAIGPGTQPHPQAAPSLQLAALTLDPHN